MHQELADFRTQTRAWLAQHCPVSMRTRMVPGEEVNGGRKRPSSNPDAYRWLEVMAEQGWTVPTWPQAYGGAGLNQEQFLVLLEELQRIRARPPLGGMGVSMLGPTLLEYGTQEQKLKFLPPIARGEVAWCQGYSEPGAGSDLASLHTRAQDCGDHFRVNGTKIWTSGAAHADWMFCLVRTDPEAPKHQGISFVLLNMDDPGVTVKPIEMINGASPFCQTFLDDVQVPKSQLVHKVNHGWEVAKRLLQHERSGLDSLTNAESAGPMERIQPELSLPDLARYYDIASVPDISSDRIQDDALRAELVLLEMQKQALQLTRRRTVQETEAQTPGPASSIFKYVEAEYVKAQLEWQLRVRGTQGLGWQGVGFSSEEISMGRLWLEAKSISIAGGSNEIQLNIIAKRVLGLPD